MLQGAKAQIEVEQPLDHQNPHQHQQGQNDPEHGAATAHEALQLLPDVEHHAARSIPPLLLSARSARLEVEANRYIGVYQLLSVMGQLTVEKLNLGIPTYDVEAYSNAVKKAPLTSTRGAALDKIMSKIAN